MAVKKRKLADLYVVGKELSLGDGDGDSVDVWVQKLTPLQHEKALRRANGVRAGVLSLKDKPKDDLDRLGYQHEFDQVTTTRDDMVEYLLSDKLASLYQVEEARLAAEDEWAKDNYLQGLTDLWEDQAKEAYALDQNDPEAKRVFEELKKFADQVEDSVQSHRMSLVRDYEDWSDERLREEVLGKVIEAAADMQWLAEYRKCEIWFSIREPDDHNKLYFENREDVDDLALETFQALAQAYAELKVDITEGKDSGETPAS